MLRPLCNNYQPNDAQEHSVTHLNEELADILALVSLQLDHFTILWVLNHCPIASKLLLMLKTVFMREETIENTNVRTIKCSIHHVSTFLKALTSFFLS